MPGGPDISQQINENLIIQISEVLHEPMCGITFLRFN